MKDLNNFVKQNYLRTKKKLLVEQKNGSQIYQNEVQQFEEWDAINFNNNIQDKLEEVDF